MKVILLKDIEKLGKKFDVRDVADGFARNFLFPRGLAEPATEEALAKIEERKAIEIKKAEEDLGRSQALAAQIDGQEIEIKVKSEEDGKLYGSITSAKITKALNDLGFEVKKEFIKLKSPIKETGEYEISLEFDHGLEAKIKVIVTAEETK